ncbi:MAG: hypothetical protein WDN31_04365 [Hyphomicrobium sp.]
MELLMRYPWPGNVRELRNALRFALAVSDDGIFAEHLPPEITAEPAAGVESSGIDHRDPAGSDFAEPVVGRSELPEAGGAAQGLSPPQQVEYHRRRGGARLMPDFGLQTNEAVRHCATHAHVILPITPLPADALSPGAELKRTRSFVYGSTRRPSRRGPTGASSKDGRAFLWTGRQQLLVG